MSVDERAGWCVTDLGKVQEELAGSACDWGWQGVVRVR